MDWAQGRPYAALDLGRSEVQRVLSEAIRELIQRDPSARPSELKAHVGPSFRPVL